MIETLSKPISKTRSPEELLMRPEKLSKRSRDSTPILNYTNPKKDKVMRQFLTWKNLKESLN